jgi:hypothetical protein
MPGPHAISDDVEAEPGFIVRNPAPPKDRNRVNE